MLLVLDRSIEQLKPLASDELTEDEVLALVREAAANLERFAKRLRVGSTPKTTLYELINELSSRGLPLSDADALHELRMAANLGKHDSAKAVTLDDALLILVAARSAVSRIGVVGTAPGADEPVLDGQSRQFAVAVFDYPTHGEVEYQVFVLLNDGQILPVDAYQAQFNSEQEIKAALKDRGSLDENPTDEGVKAYRRLMRGSSELSYVWTFEGSLGDLSRAFAPRQHSEALSFLRRGSDSQEVRTAVCLAAVDLGLERAGDPENLIDRMINHYAIPLGSLGRVPTEMSALARCASQNGVAEFQGPRVLSPAAFRLVASDALCFSEVLEIAINAGGSIAVRQNSAFAPMP
jgi:Domain of unknown function (DUF4145)